MRKFSIVHLYPVTLHLNGEVGNVIAITERAKAFGLDVDVANIEVGTVLPEARPDLLFLGSGILSAAKVASKDLESKSKQLLDWVASGTKVLAVGAGFDLISDGLEIEPGVNLFGLGLTGTSHRLTSNHLVGEVVAEGGIAGFINWNREIRRGPSSPRFTTVTASDNSKLVGYVDGYRSERVIATNIQGPFLPMNPRIADELLGIEESSSASARITTLDELAEKSRAAISRRVNR